MKKPQEDILSAYQKLNDTYVRYPQKLLHQLIQEQAQKTPDSIAIEFNDTKITYQALEEQSNKIAHYLITKGVKPNDLVGVCLPRSGDVLLVFLAIIKCGAAYVPLDTANPPERLTFMLQDSGASLLVTNKALANGFSPNQETVLLEQLKETLPEYPATLPDINIAIDTLVYMIYTSGSTGKPKGVPISHKNLVNFLTSMAEKPGIDQNDRVVALTVFSFDISKLELYAPLIVGGCVVMADAETVLDNQRLLKFIAEKNISLVQTTPTRWQLLLDAGWETPLPIKALTGGEPSSKKLVADLLSRCNSAWNIYGPTETTVWSSLKKFSKEDELVTIGTPIRNTAIYILDEAHNLLPHGSIGEIAITGEGVSQGYWKREALTAEKFIANTIAPEQGEIIYKTGDLGKILDNGDIQCLGRADQQVKVRGHRIELGEIETAIESIPKIQKAVVIVNTKMTGEPQLVAYIKADVTLASLKDFNSTVAKNLPEYMLPSYYVEVANFKRTVSGKIDRKLLPEPKYNRPVHLPPLVRPKDKNQKLIAKIWSSVLRIDQIGIDDNFFDMGGTSILAQKAMVLLQKELQTQIPITKIYQFPSIRQLAKTLAEVKPLASQKSNTKTKKTSDDQDIAVIGMAGRFPGADSVAALWEVLLAGQETITHYTKEEVSKAVPENLRNDPNYVGSRGVVPTAKTFDARFFGINPKLASAMDPQQRLFLEIAWEVLEETGYLPKHYQGSVGVYAGCGLNTYFNNNILPNQELMGQFGEFLISTVNDKDYMATRTAYHLNLKGPAVSVHSACSTSLLAIAEATEALRKGQCNVALAGAASITAPMESGHLYQEGSIKTPDGHCRPFDANGKGTMFSDGAAVVLLKPLKQAEEDGDTIFGIIKGVGLSNDGGDKGSFTAPSAQGQAAAITQALEDAQVNPSEISYIEAHGTATPVGDPIEIAGLEMAFGPQENKNFCAIGSIKSNIGHLTSAAGAAGFIKTMLALKHKTIPASLGYTKPNPLINFDQNPFYVNHSLSKWEAKGPRKAGISSFGVGGTNVHVVVEEYIEKPKKAPSPGRPLQLLSWSAKTENSLAAYQEALDNHLNKNTNSLADIAYTLQTTKEDFGKRSFALVAEDNKVLSQNKTLKSKVLSSVPDQIGFMFPGQGSQYLQMGKTLYAGEADFKEAVDFCSEILREPLGLDIRDIIFPKENSPEAEARLKDTQYTQPAMFVMEYALAKLWMGWGLQPSFVCGHSIGEFVAAHIAGILSLEDALHLIAIRGKMISDLPSGSMLSIRAAAAKIEPLLPAHLSMAAINSDNLCVVSGTDEAIEAFAKKLKEDGIANTVLATSHAFHSAMMDPILPAFEAEVKKVKLQKPHTPLISTVSGTWLTDQEATNPSYWANHLRDAVRFSDALDTMLAMEEPPVLVEVGPGRALTTLTRQKKEGRSLAVITTLPVPKNGQTDYHSLLNGVGELWLNGIAIDWKLFYKDQNRQKVQLPTYAFDRKACWVAPPIQNKQPLNGHHKTIVNEIAAPQQELTIPNNTTHNNTTVMRKDKILDKIAEIISKTSGIDLEASEYDHSFLELGLDSLILTQMAGTLKNEFKTDITFRQLNDELGSPALLASFLDGQLPADAYADVAIPQPQATAPPPVAQQIPIPQNTTIPQPRVGDNNTALGLIAQQLQLLGQQIALLQGDAAVPAVSATHASTQMAAAAPSPVRPQPLSNIVAKKPEDLLTAEEKKAHQKPFGASPKIEKSSTALTTHQEDFLKALISRYNQKTKGSKAATQEHRPYMADPRVVSGFKPLTKELVYPIVIKKSAGNRLWDVDNNEYIDVLNGFGACLFGHQPDFIKEALHQQIDLGFEVGPQHPLAGEVCKLMCEFTGHDRAALCNTGSEAVLGAMRIARTVTGRNLIVSFAGSYHGINDEALVRGSKKLKTFPAAAGILPDAVQNVLVLDYGTEESLQIIKERAHELAAVLVEPVQSRRPEFQPIEFLKEVRKITEASNTALIFDEIITGFRFHPGGTQALFDIKADLATYGKVIGGGISIGAIAGAKRFMDALDGGTWQYGDSSFPEIGVTYFAGTFVRHPLALASCKASLNYMKAKGPALQERLNQMTLDLVNKLNHTFTQRALPLTVTYYGSLWRLKVTEDLPYAELLFVLLREKGIHIMDGFPCYMTVAFKQEDIDKVFNAIIESIEELLAVGILTSGTPLSNTNQNGSTTIAQLNVPPVPGAKLGMDEDGNPAWYFADESKNGSLSKISLSKN